jgi:hypothetical protein
VRRGIVPSADGYCFQARTGMECAESFNPCAARPGPRRRALQRVGRDRCFQRTITLYSSGSTLSVYPGSLACRQRVKRFRRMARDGTITLYSSASTLSVCSGSLACRQRVKRFSILEPAIQTPSKSKTGSTNRPHVSAFIRLSIPNRP